MPHFLSPLSGLAALRKIWMINYIQCPSGITVMKSGTLKLAKMQKCASSNAFNAIMETNWSSERACECPIVNPPECVWDVDLCYRAVVMSDGCTPNLHEAFTQLHLGQLLAFVKCYGGDRRYRGINHNSDHILWNNSSSLSRVDEDLGIAVLGQHTSNINVGIVIK